MDELIEAFVRLLARVGAGAAKAVIWLAWEISIELVAWSVGWATLRVATLGHWPACGIKDYDSVEWPTRLVVLFVGISVPASLAVWVGGSVTG